MVYDRAGPGKAGGVSRGAVPVRRELLSVGVSYHMKGPKSLPAADAGTGTAFAVLNP